MFRPLTSVFVAALMGLASFPGLAQLEGGGLEGGGLDGGGGLGGSSGLGGAKLRTGGLQGGRLQPSSIEGSKLESPKSPQGARRLNPATLKRKASELAAGGLGAAQLQGAASTIPRTQVGELLYDVAGAILLLEENLTEVAVGYYMAVLADPQGERFEDALKELHGIFSNKELEHSDAVRLYDGGLETMKSLVGLKIGLTKDGEQSALRSLQEVKAAYHQRRKREQPKEIVIDPKMLEETSDDDEFGPAE